MSACLSAAASLTASPVIATISPCSCISRARRSLSCGVTRPNTCSSGSRRGELLVGHRLQLGAADRAGPEAERLADRPRGDGVVAGDHAHVDPRAERRLDGGLASGRSGSMIPTRPTNPRSWRQRHRVVGHRRRARRPRRSGPRRRARADPSRPSARSPRRFPRGPPRSAPASRSSGRRSGCSAPARRRVRP